MADLLPPIPYDKPQTSFEWIDWYTKLIAFVNAGASHQTLTNIQGGTTNEYYHLTQTQHTDLLDGGFSTLHKHESFPVGITILTDSATNPSSMIGYGTWTLLGTTTI